MTPVVQPTDLIICTATDLMRLLDDKSHYRRIHLQVPGLPDTQRQRWQDELAHHYSSCGCGAGNVFGILGVAAAGTYLVAAPVSASPWAYGGFAFAIVVAFTLLGKLVGMLRARMRLRAAVMQLSKLLDAVSPDSSPATR